MLKPATLFTDGAILCRRKEIRVFGEAAEGAEVHVTLMDEKGETLAEAVCHGREGHFLAMLPPQEAHTGCRLMIASGEERLVAEDVAIGEVYLAGGQSNMELALRNADEGRDLIRNHQDPLIRFYNVPRKSYVSTEQQKALEETRWRAIAPGEGEDNSAVAYFFAMALRKKEPDLPIGIIGCYWGGTSIACWMDEQTLNRTAEGSRYLREYAELTRDKSLETWKQEDELFQASQNRWNGLADVYRREHPGAKWSEIEAACGTAPPWCPPPGPGSPYRPAGLVAPMLRAVAPVSITAILYYQGEEDACRTDEYDLLMILLIRFWRGLFRESELLFLFVQLPMWLDNGAEDTFRWPLTRLAQAAARDAVRNTGMICLLDQGEYGNIHPTAKRPVGERLAQLAGAMLRGEGEVSPRVVSRAIYGSELILTLSAPVEVRGDEPPALLELAGEDGAFAPARGEIRKNQLILTSEAVDHPVRARYAWTDYSERVNLFGLNGLPLEPFDC